MKTFVTLIILSISMASFGQITNGLVGHWPLDNNANDVVGTNNGTAFGVQPTVDREGNSNSAYEFGANRYIQLGDPATSDFGSQTFTLSAWVNRTQTAFNYENIIMSKWNTGASPGTNEWIFSLSPHTSGDNPTFSIEIGTSKHQVVSTVEINLNEWYHIAAVRRTTTIEIYVNGALTGIKSIPNLPVNNVGRDLQIGRFGTNFYLEGGELDDIKIFNRDLSGAEIIQLHSSSNQISTTNTFLGYTAGENNTTGEDNTFIGANAGSTNTTGFRNTFLGFQSGTNTTVGNSNLFSGFYSGRSNTTGSNNVFMGNKSGSNNTTGLANVFVGDVSGEKNTTGQENVFIGKRSGTQNTAGKYNVFVGASSGDNNLTGDYNTFSGYKSGNANTTGEENVFTGSYSGHTNTTGGSNVFIGHFSGYDNTIGRNNIFIGSHSGRSNTEGNYNVFMGTIAGNANSTGSLNAFVGFESGKANTEGSGNTFFGSYSGNSTTTGAANTFVGSASGGSNTNGGGNTFLGNYSGSSSTTSDFNTFLGNYSGFKNTTGGNNVFLGNQSGYENISGLGNIFIGYQAGYNEVESNKLYIDNSNTTTPLLYGDFSSDQLGVNTNVIPAGYAFAVKGKMIAEELKIQVFPWADFVFETTYQLPTLAEVEKYILEKGHLKDIPSAVEVAKNGISVGQMDAKLLQKIEELTLYTIQQEKELKEQKEINKKLAARLLKIEEFITKSQKK